MDFATGAAIAGATAAASIAYLDGRYHLFKDIGNIREERRVAKLGQELAVKNKRSLWYLFEEQALLRKDAPCLWYRQEINDPPVELSWTQTYEKSLQWSQFLLDSGVQSGDLVSTFLQNSTDFLLNMLGSWAIGCAPSLINFHLSGDGLIHCLKVGKSKVLIVDPDEECQERIRGVQSKIEELGMKIIVLDAATKARILGLEPKRPENLFRDRVTGEFPIFLFFTSGSTGLPKACAFQTQRAYGLGKPRQRSTGIVPGDTWYDCMPLYHGTGCTVAVGCMMSGVRLAIGRKFSTSRFWHDIHDSNANGFVYVGETARYLLAAPPSPLDKDHKLKAMFGNGMRPDVWLKFQERFNVPVVNEFFNSTEGMFGLLNVCRGPFHVAHVGHHGALMRRRYQNIYIPVEIDYERGDAIWRDPKTGFARRKSYEEGGEIIVACQSEGDFVGYWNNPEATSKRFERNVFRKGDIYYRTGDALRRDNDGRWFFMDRLGDTFRWKSENVSTAQVGEVLGDFPGLVEANVYGVEIPNHDGRAGCAAVYIRPDERKNFDYAGLLQHARKRLPRYAVPVFLRVIQSPTPAGMHNNKQNKVPLRKEGADLRLTSNGDAMMWLAPGANTYKPFLQRDWDSIVGGKVRL